MAYRTEIYKTWTGVRFQWKWQARDQFLEFRKFVENLLGLRSTSDRDEDFFVFETEQQYDTAAAFRQKLLRRARGIEEE